MYASETLTLTLTLTPLEDVRLRKLAGRAALHADSHQYFGFGGRPRLLLTLTLQGCLSPAASRLSLDACAELPSSALLPSPSAASKLISMDMLLSATAIRVRVRVRVSMDMPLSVTARIFLIGVRR